MNAGWDDTGQAEWLESAGVELVRGHGRLAGERAVDVEAADGQRRRLIAKKAVVLAVGSDPSVPPVEGLASAQYWTNREITSASAVPERLIVLGGGPVGVENGARHNGDGLAAAEVTLIGAGERLLGRMEPFVGAAIASAFDSEGITVKTGTGVELVTRTDGNGPVRVELADGTEVVDDEIVKWRPADILGWPRSGPRRRWSDGGAAGSGRRRNARRPD